MNVEDDAHFNSPSSQFVVVHVFSPIKGMDHLK